MFGLEYQLTVDEYENEGLQLDLKPMTGVTSRPSTAYLRIEFDDELELEDEQAKQVNPAHRDKPVLMNGVYVQPTIDKPLSVIAQEFSPKRYLAPTEFDGSQTNQESVSIFDDSLNASNKDFDDDHSTSTPLPQPREPIHVKTEGFTEHFTIDLALSPSIAGISSHHLKQHVTIPSHIIS